MFKVAMALGSVVASIFLPAATAQASTSPLAPPPAERVVIEVAGVNGSGCPNGSASVDVSDDNSSFTVTIDEYEPAWVGPGAAPTDLRKNCQIGLRIIAPSGFTYALAQANYGGFAHVADGATAQQRALYYFQGSADQISRSHSFAGPHSGPWRTTDRIDFDEMIWQECGGQRHLNINSSLVLLRGTSAPDRTSFIAMGGSDGIKATYHLAWRWC